MTFKLSVQHRMLIQLALHNKLKRELLTDREKRALHTLLSRNIIAEDLKPTHYGLELYNK